MPILDKKGNPITIGALVAVHGRIVRTPTAEEVTIKPEHDHAPPFYMKPRHIEVLVGNAGGEEERPPGYHCGVHLPSRWQIGEKVSVPDPLLAAPGDARVNARVVGILFRAAPDGTKIQYTVLAANFDDVVHLDPNEVDSPVEEAPAETINRGEQGSGTDAATLDYAKGKELALEGGTLPDHPVSEAYAKGFHDGCVSRDAAPTTQDGQPQNPNPVVRAPQPPAPYEFDGEGEPMPPGHPPANMKGLPTEAEKPLPPVEEKKDEGPGTEKAAE